MKRALIAGSFDPVTKGHADVIVKAAQIFDEVYVCVLRNADKHTMFTDAERLRILKKAVEGLAAGGVTNVRADSFDGLTSDYMKDHGIRFIVKGVRNSTDFDYEYGMAQIMKKFMPSCETVLIPARPEHIHISSSFVKELIRHGGPLEDALPDGTADMKRDIYDKRI